MTVGKAASWSSRRAWKKAVGEGVHRYVRGLINVARWLIELLPLVGASSTNWGLPPSRSPSLATQK
jgi:hypothetical protein